MTENDPRAGDLTRTSKRSRHTFSGETLEQVRHNFSMILRASESDDFAMGGLFINPIGREKAALHTKEKSDRFVYDLVLMSILARAEAQLAVLEARMAQRYERLREKYGDDVIGGIAATYLNEDQLTGLDTEEEMLEALAALLLDEHGNIRPQYAHLEEAKYVRDWKKAQELKPVVEKYQGRDYLTEDEAREIQAASRRASLSDNSSSIMASDNAAYKATVDAELDAARSGKMDAKTIDNFTFG